METSTELFQNALQCHNAGHIDQAEALYGEILQADPENPDVLHLMGMAAQQRGNSEEASGLIEHAIRLAPDRPNFHNSLGVVYESRDLPEKAFSSYIQAASIKNDYVEAIQNIIRLRPDYYPAHFNLGIALQNNGRYEEAAGEYIQTLKLQPNLMAAYNNLGIVLHKLGKIREAVSIYRQVTDICEDAYEVYNNLGLALQDLQETEEAAQCFEKAIQHNPEYAEAYMNLGRLVKETDDMQTAIRHFQKAVTINPDYTKAYYELGLVLQADLSFDESNKALQQVLRLNPDHAEAHFAMGGNLAKMDKTEQAIREYERAVALKPSLFLAYYNMAFLHKQQGNIRVAIAHIEKVLHIRSDMVEAHNELGVLLQAEGRLEEAVEKYRQALLLNENYPIAHYNMGCALQDLFRMEEAKQCFRKAIALDPDYAEAHVNLALLLLLEGDMKAGWEEYEWRFQRPDWENTYPEFSQIPFWNGENFAGKRLLVRNEQGMGDTLQFIRYLPMVQKRGGTVIFEVEEPLFSLLEKFPGVDEMILYQKEIIPDNIDLQVFLVSLPRIFETTLETIPCPIPYVQAAPQSVEYWTDTIGTDGLKVGIVWSGNPDNPDDRFRSIDLEKFKPLLTLPDVRFFGLQKGTGAQQADALTTAENFSNLGAELKDFRDTAGLIKALDLVIAVDTSIVHLAGAMGKPVWVLRPARPYWVWLDKRQDSPWYPTARIYRQNTLGIWEDVLKAVARDLQKLVEQAGKPWSASNQ